MLSAGGCVDPPAPAAPFTPSGTGEGATGSTGPETSDPSTTQNSTPGSTTSGAVDSGGPSSSSGDAGPKMPAEAEDVLRVQVNWSPDAGYAMGPVTHDRSGTEALRRRAQEGDVLGSFLGTVTDDATGEELFSQTIGIGILYRDLARGITFRFPFFDQPATFTLVGPNPQSGAAEVLLEAMVDPQSAEAAATAKVSTSLLLAAVNEPALALNVYAEGYLAGSEDRFVDDARRFVDVLVGNSFPGLDHLQITAVYATSNQPLGDAEDLGLPVQRRDSFLGLYHPYWADFSRWFHVMYPTDESHFRDALAAVPYDYPVVLIDSDEFWGTGNYNTYTAIPAGHDAFEYLTLHEIGHFFGLNEEYSSGDTELLFAPGAFEPWSQNLTLQSVAGAIKWNAQIDDDVPIPTDDSAYPTLGVGAYRGGYAGEDANSLIPVPDGVCTMSDGLAYCPVCSAAIVSKLEADLAP